MKIALHEELPGLRARRKWSAHCKHKRVGTIFEYAHNDFMVTDGNGKVLAHGLTTQAAAIAVLEKHLGA